MVKLKQMLMTVRQVEASEVNMLLISSVLVFSTALFIISILFKVLNMLELQLLTPHPFRHF